MGRASIASAVPDSTSVAIAGAARNAPDMASTKLNMNAMITSTCEMPSVMRVSSMPDVARVGHELGDRPAHEHDARHRQAQQDPQQAAAAAPRAG